MLYKSGYFLGSALADSLVYVENQEAVDILRDQLWDTLFVLETYGSDHLIRKSCGLCHHNFPVSSHFFEHSDYVLCPKCGKPT